jgi:hypothetical protein
MGIMDLNTILISAFDSGLIWEEWNVSMAVQRLVNQLEG